MDNEQLKRAYIDVFGEGRSGSAQAVLDDLADICYAHGGLFAETDRETARRIGKHEIFEHIMRYIT